jgi:hypothetical protein
MLDSCSISHIGSPINLDDAGVRSKSQGLGFMPRRIPHADALNGTDDRLLIRFFDILKE